MKRINSLRRRIVLAYVALACCFSILFAAIAAIAVEGIEYRLVDERLMSIAAWASPRHMGKLPVEMPTGLSFYHGDAIPLSLRGLPLGVQEIFIDDADLHVLAGRDAAGDYVVVDHASDYEKIERVVYSMVAIGILGFLTLSLLLGSFIARRVVTPITILAAAVINKNPAAELPLLTNTDEMGVLARAFAAHTAQLKQFLERERFFTGDVSHELRTPLTVIIGAAEILMAQTRDQPALQASAERILRAATEASECVTVLLLLARASESIDASETLVSKVIETELERCQPLIRDKPVLLQCQIQADFPLLVRRELLAAAIGNLLRNACQYTLAGSVLVKLDRYSIIIEDTGPGVPAAIRAQLLGELLPAALTGATGAGLGLALVKRICEHIGAVLTLTERPHGGSIFSLDFPRRLIKP